MKNSIDKVLVAMSGGVDSSVAAWVLQRDGFDCIGAMMKLYDGDDDCQSGCCSLADAEDARAVAFRLNMPFYVFNFTDTFGEQVIDRFVAAYQSGRTPNPCIDCNRHMKFERFLARAKEIDCPFIATGHYARVECDNGRRLLKKSVDTDKDQTYVLYAMTQSQLAATKFPLGELTKLEVRRIAEEQEFINAAKRDSQDICFAPDGNYAGFIEEYTGRKSNTGQFKDNDGNVLGRHKGIIHYTIGQRKGLGISAPQPIYVSELSAENNTVVVGPEDKLYTNSLTATDINLIAVDRLNAPMRVGAKIRYSQSEQPAKVWQLDDDTLKVEFDTPQRAITKGQAVVLYDGDIVVGGGTISDNR